MNKTTQEALKALDGMREIVRAEMLTRGEYVTEEVEPSRSDSICGGRRYCAVGALWAGAGVRPRRTEDGYYLPGVEESERDTFTRRRRALGIAYDALNEATNRYIKREGLEDEVNQYFDSPLEGLFESSHLDVGRPELLKIIASAKRKLKVAA